MELAIMALSKLKKAGVFLLSIASVSLLAACDKVEAQLPTAEYNDPLITNYGNTTNNTLGKIYDALVTSGDTNSEKVLSNVLYLYAQSVYGDFFKMKDVVDAYEADTTNATATANLQAFADTYSVYKAKASDSQGNINKVINFYLDVLYRIRATFLGYVSNNTYQVRNLFVEKKFYDAQVTAYYDLNKDDTGAAKYTTPYNETHQQVLGNFRLSETYLETGSYLLDGKGTATNAYFKDIFGVYKNYIALAVLPDLYRSELTTQYLYSQNFGQIKQTAYRKVDYISLAENASYSGSVGNLLISYAKNVLSTDSVKDWAKYGFTFLGDLYKGTTYAFDSDQTTLAATIYTDANWHTAKTTALPEVDGWKITDYYKESSIGAIVTSYEKLTNNRFTDNTTSRNDFTNNGAYTVETGLAVKIRTLVATDKTTHGWYDKAGLSSLTSVLANRLFKVQVANEVDNNIDSSGNYLENDNMTYGRYVKGNYYLLPDTYESSAAYPYLYMDSSSNWYIVKVDEAVKPAKVDADTTTSETGSSAYYDNMPKHANDHFFAEQVSRKIAYSLATSDTWKSKANKYYVNQMAILYHDTYVYDYFKTTFPSLFE
jgi:hypothetical protein